MKKFFGILSGFLVVVSLVFGGNNSFEIEKRLYELQNSIVKNSFINLQKGAWAKYNDGTKAIYAGEDVIDGMKLKGIEIHFPKGVIQIWYKVVEKKFNYNGKNYTLLTLDPRTVFINTGGMAFKINYAQLQLAEQFMGAENLSTILTPAKIYIGRESGHKVSIQDTTMPVGGRSVKATIITSLDNGGKVIVSTEVPFGLVNSQGDTPHLVNFGKTGGRIRMGAGLRKSAQKFSFPVGF